MGLKEELIKSLRHFSVETPEYNLRKDLLESILKAEDPKYLKQLVCVPTDVSAGFCITGDNSKILNTVADITDGVSRLLFYDKFSVNDTFPNNKSFKFVNRYNAEYNLNYRQLVVCTYITDGEQVILLKTFENKTRIDNKITMIQGHVEFDNEIYYYDQISYLQKYAQKELNEELKNVDGFVGAEKLIVPRLPRYYIDYRETFGNLEHIGVVFELPVRSAKYVFSHIESGEPDIHKPIILYTAELSEHLKDMDNWTANIMKKRFNIGCEINE